MPRHSNQADQRPRISPDVRASKQGAFSAKSQIKLYQIIIATEYAGSDRKVFFIDPDTGDRILAFVGAHSCLSACS